MAFFHTKFQEKSSWIRESFPKFPEIESWCKIQWNYNSPPSIEGCTISLLEDVMIISSIQNGGAIRALFRQFVFFSVVCLAPWLPKKKDSLKQNFDDLMWDFSENTHLRRHTSHCYSFLGHRSWYTSNIYHPSIFPRTVLQNPRRATSKDFVPVKRRSVLGLARGG